MRFHDLPEQLKEHLAVRRAEIMAFPELREADEVATHLRRMLTTNPDYQVLTFAAGMYYVVLITPDFIEDTDVTHTNP